MVSALVILAEGAEEMETVITIDVLRRAGVTVTVGGLSGASPVKCSRDVVIVPDKSIQQAVTDAKYDAVVIPGGLKGSENIGSCDAVKTLLQEQEKNNGLIAAICAGPTALMSHKICSGKKVTSYPAFKEKLVKGGYQYSEDRVVVDGKLITSQGPGTSFDFALAIVKALTDEKKAESVAEPMLLKLK
ncbi:protein/nucleic acid deglycase DJ-1-like [Argonauta hians]